MLLRTINNTIIILICGNRRCCSIFHRGGYLELEKLVQAVQLIKAGNKRDSIPLLKEVLRSDPNNENAWSWLYICVETVEQKKHCLQQILRIHPENEKALVALQRLGKPNLSSPDEFRQINHEQKQIHELSNEYSGTETGISSLSKKPPSNGLITPYKNKVGGGSTYEMAESRRKAMITIAVIGVIIFLIILAMLNNIQALGVGGIGALILLGLLRIFPDILDGILGKKQKEVKRAIRGADAEVQIDTLLNNLSEEYYVLNDLVSPYGNIDHVVICRNGSLFLLETKSHYGKVSVNNHVLYINGHLPEKDFIAQVSKNTYWLREKITEITGVKYWVQPIIVFTNAFVPFMSPIKSIKVINKKYLISTIKNTSGQGSANSVLWEKRDKINENMN